MALRGCTAALRHITLDAPRPQHECAARFPLWGARADGARFGPTSFGLRSCCVFEPHNEAPWQSSTHREDNLHILWLMMGIPLWAGPTKLGWAQTRAWAESTQSTCGSGQHLTRLTRFGVFSPEPGLFIDRFGAGFRRNGGGFGRNFGKGLDQVRAGVWTTFTFTERGQA